MIKVDRLDSKCTPTETSTGTKPERHHTRSQREQTSLNGSSEVGREKEGEGKPINGE